MKKEGSEYFLKYERGFQYPHSDDCNFMHKEISWCDYFNPYCVTHLQVDKKEKELSFQKPGNYIMTLQDQALDKELNENAKKYDPL